MTGYRGRLGKPTTALWLLVAGADVALATGAGAVAPVAALAGVAAVAATGVGARAVLAGRDRPVPAPVRANRDPRRR
jgi:hypothetical protein